MNIQPIPYHLLYTVGAPNCTWMQGRARARGQGRLEVTICAAVGEPSSLLGESFLGAVCGVGAATPMPLAYAPLCREAK